MSNETITEKPQTITEKPKTITEKLETIIGDIPTGYFDWSVIGPRLIDAMQMLAEEIDRVESTIGVKVEKKRLLHEPDKK